jgi:hypothetical protein
MDYDIVSGCSDKPNYKDSKQVIISGSMKAALLTHWEKPSLEYGIP